MGKTVKKTAKPKPDMNRNPTGRGGFAEKPRAGPGRGKKKPPSKVGGEILADLERAYTTDEQPTDPPGVKRARRMAHDEFPKFLAMYTRLKCEQSGQPAPQVAAAATVEVGPKEESIEELAMRLLHEWEVASDGIRPTA